MRTALLRSRVVRAFAVACVATLAAVALAEDEAAPAAEPAAEAPATPPVLRYQIQRGSDPIPDPGAEP